MGPWDEYRSSGSWEEKNREKVLRYKVLGE
jgi:hypothetical protein